MDERARFNGESPKSSDTETEEQQSEPSDDQIQQQLDSYEAYRRNYLKSKSSSDAKS